MIEFLQMSQVLDAVRATGTEVRYHHEHCNDGKRAGFYRIGGGVDMLVICPENNRNLSDLFDTIRHEAMHVVQACIGKPVLPYDYYLKNVSDATKQSLANYPQDLHTQHHEIEAHHAAEFGDEKLIVNTINKFCFK